MSYEKKVNTRWSQDTLTVQWLGSETVYLESQEGSELTDMHLSPKQARKVAKALKKAAKKAEAVMRPW